MKNLNFINHENGSEGLKNRGLTGLRVAVKSRIGTRSLRNTLLPVLIGTLLLTLGVGQMWANAYWPYAGFYEVYMTYSYSGNNSNYTFYASDNNSSQSVSLGTLTADFKINSLYLKCYKNTGDWSKYGNLCGGLMIYNTGSGDNEYQPSWTWTDKNTWSDTYQAHLWELSKTSCNKVIASYNSGASGSYTAQLSFKMWGSDDNGSNCDDNWWISNNSNNYKFTYNIAPPAVKSGTVAVSATNTAAGSGSGLSAESPIILISGFASRLTITAEQGRTDANSALWCKFGSNSYSATTTYDIAANTLTSNQTLALAVKYRNNSASLDGAETTTTIYYKWAAPAPAITMTSVTPSSSIVAGNDITLVGTRANSSNTISFQYTTNDGSTWTDITPKTTSGDSPKTITWTVPDAHGATQTFKFRAKLAEATPIYSSKSSGVSVYNTKTIKVKNTNNWGTFYSYVYNSESDKREAWHGSATGITSAGGQWKNVVLTSQYAYFILNDNGSNQIKGDNTYTYSSSVTDGNCYAISSGTGTSLTFSSATCPSAPTSVTTTATPTSITNAKMTLNGDIGGNGNDNITDYGFYYGTTSACGTKAQVGTSNTTGAISKQITGLTAGTTYYFKAYATNGQGTSYGDVESYKLPYKVTVSKPTGCSEITNSGTNYTNSTIEVTATKTTGYTFSSWSTTNGTQTSTSSTSTTNTLVFTPTSDNATIAPVYTENMTTVTLVASPTGKGSFTIGGDAATSTTVGVTTTRSVTAVPATGYRVNTSTTVWSKNNANITLNNVKANPVTVTGAGSGGTSTLTATFTPITYSIHFNGNGNTSGSMSNQTGVTYDAATTITANAFGRTGYNFAGWATTQERANAGIVDRTDGAAHGNLASTQGATAQLWAVWTAKTTTISYSQSGTGYGSGGQVATKTATYDAAMPTPISTPTAANGYAFMGYYDALEPLGTKYYNANGTSARTWNKEDAAVTLYAYFKKAEITALTLDATVVEIKGTVGVTPTISPTPTGDYKLCFYVFHGNDNPLDPQPEITWNGTKATFSAGATSGTFKIGVSLRTGSSCGGGTLLDSTTVSYQVAGVHTVTVRYKCGDDVIKASTSLEGIRPLDWSADITAPAITGYSFTEWEAGDGVTIKDAAGSDKTTSTYQTIKIKAVYDGYLTAKYSKKRVIYFNNTLNWANVYVYFYNSNGYWNDSKGVGSRTGGAYSGIHGQMQPIEEGSKIYYFDAEAAGVNSSWTHVAFTELEQTNYEFFAQTASKNNKVAYRGDYYATKLPMFVPLDVSESKNSGLADYYNKGYWMNYPENTGYTLKIYNQKATDGAVELKSIPFEFAENKAMPMELNVDLEAGKTYGFKIYRNDGLNTGAGSFYGNTGTMTANTEGWDMTTDASSNTGLQTTAAGSYKFLLNYYAVSSNYQYRVSVTYPVASGDYRLLYKDDVHTAWHPSAVVAKANAKDTVSFFVRTGKHAYLKLQKCTGLGAGTVTWKDTVTWWNNGSGIPAAVTQDSVYNICLKHNASNGKLEIEKVEAYTGNYYIRVDAANSKWDNYRTDPDHLMTYSEYSIKHGGYSHYYCHWIKTDDRKNIKFVIANDYSPCISDTLVRETASGEWENIGTFIESNGDIKCNANVRFMWYQHDNTIKRAYVDGAQEDGSEFLLMLNTDATAKIKWADGTALTDKKVTFSDNGNWIYEANVQAQPNAKIRLKSTWGEGTTIVQYFKGSSSTSEDLIGGSGTDWYPIRVLYDFKTNRIVASYVPATGTINSDVQINADVMFIREHQGDIAQLTFGVSGSISKIETAYGVLRFNKWTINNKDKSTHSPLASPKSRYERDLFYVSFPFRVSLEEVFGFGTYGKHWIVEYYDGAARAANGFWAETPTFWRFYTNRKGVFLEPNQGYILALDLDNLGESSDVWANTENVELYFPSYGSMPTITSSSVTHELPEHECTINRPTPDGNRTIKDSHWNIMSVPTYVNTNNVTFANDTWTASKPSFLYTWNMDDNSLTATSGKGYTYKAMHAYTVQYCGDVTWTTSVSPSSIVAHRTYAEAPSEVEFCLELQQNENMIDRTFVRMSNDADVDAEFVFGEDMSKDFNRNKANIYTKVTTLMDDELTVTEVAGNCLPMSEQTTVVPMGIMTPNAGTYTIAIPSGTSGVGVTLIDNETGIRTNLALMDYTVDLDAATYDDRFVLEISPMKHLTTDIEGVDDGQDEKIRKVLIDQQMYIIKDKTVFDARGARVK